MRRYRSVLAHPDLRRLLIAFVVDSCGTWASAVVLTVWVYDRTGSLLALALLASARWVPGLVAAPFAGALADRFDRRTILVVSASINAVLTGAIAGTVLLSGPVPLVLALLAVSTLAGSPYRPAAGALTPDVVAGSELPAANSLLALVENVVVLIGPVLGAALLLLHDPAVAVGSNAASFAIAAVVAARLRTRSRGTARRGGGALLQIARGMSALREAPTAGVLLGFAAVDTLLAWAYGVVYVPLSDHLGLGPGGYGLLLSAAAIGGILGALLAARLGSHRRVAPWIVMGVLIQALPYAATAFTTQPALGVGLQVVSGAGMVLVEVLTLLAVQQEVPVGRLSSVLGLLDLVVLASSAVGSFAASAVLTSLRTPEALLVLGLCDSGLALLLAPLLVGVDRRAALRTAALADRVGALDRLPLFHGLPLPRLEALAAVAEPWRLASGELLLAEGTPADALWVLLEGRLAVTSRAGAALPDVHAPDVVGEIGVLRGLTRTATVIAADSCEVWRIDADDYLDSLSAQRALGSMLGTPTARLRRTNPELVDRM